MRTHEQKHQSRGFESIVDVALPITTCGNHAVMPFQYATVALVHDQLPAHIVH